jgi:uncharacterized protein
MTQPQAASELAWLLNNLASQVEHIREALVFSGDGLLVAASEKLGRQDAERLAALAAGLQSLARGAGQQLRGGEARQTIIEMDSLFLLVTEAGEGTFLAVTTAAQANVGVVSYEMAMLVRRMGKYLTARPRGA